MKKQPQRSSRNTSDLMRYAGWGTQMFIMLALAVWGGEKLDGHLGLSIPLLVWILPFVVLVVMIYQLIKDTSKRKSDHDQ